MCDVMEGELWKWTNYWNGWQMRWVVLDEKGILSYYKSQEEVSEGCKGSLNVAACEIRVHPTDILRLEISIPGEQYLYLRANSEKERQEWLVALGSAKACLNQGVYRRRKSIKTKKSELRLYCDLLIQQVYTLKSAIQDGVEVDKLTEGSSLLLETCDTFIRTLDETMALSDSSYSPDQPSYHSRRTSIDSRMTESERGFKSVFGTNNESEYDVHKDDMTDKKNGFEESISNKRKNNKIDNGPMTFVTILKNPFNEIDSDQLISTKKFLQSSEAAILIFDFLDKRAFASLKIDVEGRIKCLYTKYSRDSSRYKYIQNMVMVEIDEGSARQNSSGSQALLWLLRGLMFIHNFLRRFVESNDSVEDVLLAAYETTLKRYRGWVSKSVFSVAAKNSPSRESLLISLGLPREPSDPEARKRIYHTQLFPNIAKYLDSMEKCLMILTQFYKSTQLANE